MYVYYRRHISIGEKMKKLSVFIIASVLITLYNIDLNYISATSFSASAILIFVIFIAGYMRSIKKDIIVFVIPIVSVFLFAILKNKIPLVFSIYVLPVIFLIAAMIFSERNKSSYFLVTLYLLDALYLYYLIGIITYFIYFYTSTGHIKGVVYISAMNILIAVILYRKRKNRKKQGNNNTVIWKHYFAHLVLSIVCSVMYSFSSTTYQLVDLCVFLPDMAFIILNLYSDNYDFMKMKFPKKG